MCEIKKWEIEMNIPIFYVFKHLFSYHALSYFILFSQKSKNVVQCLCKQRYSSVKKIITKYDTYD